MSSSNNGSDYKVERFGPYEVHQRLGIGGMATVHLAMERGVAGFERWVALKRLLPHYGEDEEFVRSFVREAQLASCLSHPNVVKINQLGKVGDDYFISMEYIEGRDVRALLRQARKVAGPPPLTVTASLLLELLDALDYAHRKTDDHGRPLGLVHRDISPSNLLVNVNGHLKIIDFGIAKATSQQSRTQTGKIKGKLAYISPEVLRGKAPDARSDLFSVGIIAHEMLTARPLFASKNDYKTIQRIQNAEVLPPSSQNTNCPRELDAWVLRALTKERDDRWASAREMHDALTKIIHDYHLHATTRDVASWVDWSFSLPPPERGVRERKRATRQPPRAPTLGEAEEELLDIIWGTHGGPRAPLNLSEVEAQISESPDLELETDPASAAPTALLFAVGPHVGHSDLSLDESWSKLMTVASADRVGAEIESEFESTEPNGLVGPGDSAAFGTIDLGGDLGAEDWLTDARPIDKDSALFSESELTALAEPLGGGLEARTAPASPRPLAKGSVVDGGVGDERREVRADAERDGQGDALVDLSAEKGDFDDTEPQDVGFLPPGAAVLPPPVLRRPPAFANPAMTTESQATVVRPALDPARVRTRRTSDELPTRRDRPASTPPSPEPEPEPPEPPVPEPEPPEPPEPTGETVTETEPVSDPKATATGSEPAETKQPAAVKTPAAAKSKKSTLRGLATARPDPVEVVLLDARKTKKRITSRTSVPPLPEPEEPTVTVNGAPKAPARDDVAAAASEPARSAEPASAPATSAEAASAPASAEAPSAPTGGPADAASKPLARTILSMDRTPPEPPSPPVARPAAAPPSKPLAKTVLSVDAPPPAPASEPAANSGQPLARTVLSADARSEPSSPISQPLPRRAPPSSSPPPPRAPAHSSAPPIPSYATDPATDSNDSGRSSSSPSLPDLYPGPPPPEPRDSPLVPWLIALAALSIVGSTAAYFLTRDSDDRPGVSAGVSVDAAIEAGADAAASPLAAIDAGSIAPSPDARPTPQPTSGSDTPGLQSGAPIRVSGAGAASVHAKICIDRRGHVQSVRVLENIDEALAAAVSTGVASWIYEPYRRDHKPVKACFETDIPIDR